MVGDGVPAKKIVFGMKNRDLSGRDESESRKRMNGGHKEKELARHSLQASWIQLRNATHVLTRFLSV